MKMFEGKGVGHIILRDNGPANEYECEKFCVLTPTCTHFQYMLEEPSDHLTKCKLFKGDVTKKNEIHRHQNHHFTTYKLQNKCCSEKIFEGIADGEILALLKRQVVL